MSINVINENLYIEATLYQGWWYIYRRKFNGGLCLELTNDTFPVMEDKIITDEDGCRYFHLIVNENTKREMKIPAMIVEEQ